MSEYYKGKRSRNIYDPKQKTPFKLSRSRIDLFLSCPRCFYIDRRLGVDRPPGFPFAINSAVDNLLKNEFDTLRHAGETHPLIEQFGIDARPVEHVELGVWRENFKGVQYLDEVNNFIVTGAIDDLWINSAKEYIVVDYKATAKSEPVTQLGVGGYHDGYRRQMEIYQWLLRHNGLRVSDVGYFVYCTGQPDNARFDAHVDFDMHIIPYKGDDRWVQSVLNDIKKTLDHDAIPDASSNCDHCLYVRDRANVEF